MDRPVRNIKNKPIYREKDEDDRDEDDRDDRDDRDEDDRDYSDEEDEEYIDSEDEDDILKKKNIYFTKCTSEYCDPEIKTIDDSDNKCIIKYFPMAITRSFNLRRLKKNGFTYHRDGNILHIRDKTCSEINIDNNTRIYIDIWNKIKDNEKKIRSFPYDDIRMIMMINERLQPNLEQLQRLMILDNKIKEQSVVEGIKKYSRESLPTLFANINKPLNRWVNIRKRSIALAEQIRKNGCEFVYLLDGHGRFLFDFMEEAPGIDICVVEIDPHVFKWHKIFFPDNIMNINSNIFNIGYNKTRYFYFNFCGIGREKENLKHILRWIKSDHKFMLSLSARKQKKSLRRIIRTAETSNRNMIRIDPSRRNFLTYVFE